MQVDLDFYIEDDKYTLTFDWFDKEYYCVYDDDGNVLDLSDEDEERAWQQVQNYMIDNPSTAEDYYKYWGAE